MATVTRPAVTRETIDTRWEIATTTVRGRLSHENVPFAVENKHWRTLQDELGHLTARIVGEMTEAEGELHNKFVWDLMRSIEEQAKEWALALEEARAADRAAYAAEQRAVKEEFADRVADRVAVVKREPPAVTPEPRHVVVVQSEATG